MKQITIVICCLLLSLHSLARFDSSDYFVLLDRAANDSMRGEIYKDALRHYAKTDPDSFRFFSDSSLAYFESRGNKVEEAEICSQLAAIEMSMGLTNVAQQRSQRAMDLFKVAHHMHGLANELCNMGAIEGTKGNMDVAVNLFMRSIRLQDSLGDLHGEMVAYMNVGTLYMQMGDTANARLYLSKAAAISTKVDLSDKVIALNNMMGVLYAFKGDNEEALKCFLSNLELSDSKKFLSSHVECLSYLGEYYLENGNLPKAMDYLQQGLDLATKNNLKEYRGELLLTMAQVEQDVNPKLAEEHFLAALATARESSNRLGVATVYKYLTDFYKANKRYSEALEASEMKQKLTDSLFSINKAIELSSISSAYELEKSTLRIKDLEKFSEQNIKERNLVIGVAIGTFALLLVVLVLYRKMVGLNKKLREHEQELQGLNAMKDKLLSIVGHDLRGPMAQIPALLDIYEDESTSPEEKKFMLDALREHTKSSLDMLEKLLFWGKSLVKGIQLQQEPVVVKDSVKTNIELKKLTLQDKNITVNDNTDEGLAVLADPTHLDFIIRNLISNAIKYSHPGGTIDIGTQKEGGKGYATIYVRDHGTGITPDLLPRIFNPQYSIAGTANEKGTGIGLMLCKEFAELNGGNIRVESVPGQGATFYLDLKPASVAA